MNADGNQDQQHCEQLDQRQGVGDRRDLLAAGRHGTGDAGLGLGAWRLALDQPFRQAGAPDRADVAGKKR